MHVEFDGPQIDAVVRGVGADLLHLMGVVARQAAHGGVGGVAGAGERVGDHATEAAGSAGDEDDLFHRSLGHVELLRERAYSNDAAVGAQHLAVNPAAVGSDQEGNHAGDVFRLAKAA